MLGMFCFQAFYIDGKVDIKNGNIAWNFQKHVRVLVPIVINGVPIEVRVRLAKTEIYIGIGRILNKKEKKEQRYMVIYKVTNFMLIGVHIG